jgi:hypothetical protein
MNNDEEGPVYTASQLVTAFSGGDIATLLASSNSRVEVLEVELSQITTAPQPMSVELFRGTTSVGTGGAALSVANHDPWSRAAATSVLGQPSAGNSTASATRVHAGSIEPDSGKYCFRPDYPMRVSPSQNLHVRTSTSTSSTAGVLTAMAVRFREIGKMPL